MRTKMLASYVLVAMMIAASMPFAMMMAAAAFRDGAENEGVWDDARVTGKAKPQKPGTDPSASDEPTDKTHLAVVIGIADYRRGGDLQYTDDDAYDMYNYLLSMGYQKTSIKLLIDKGATASKILTALDWLATYANSGSEVLIFYSGHGSQYPDYVPLDETDGFDECIVSHDTYLITDDRLKTEISQIESPKIGVIFDSCYSGGMNDLQGNGKVVITACAESELSYDGDSSMQNGVFTYYFMNDLYTYDNLEDAYAYSKDDVTGWGSSHGISFHPLMFDGYSGTWSFL